MKRYLLQIITGIMITSVANAGNPDRAGGAGATQLLINPYARSAGLGGSNSASIHGVEAFQYNIGGLAYTESTELVFAHVNYLQGTGTNINSLSLSQSVGSSGSVIGLTLTSWDVGNIYYTTEYQTENTLGTFSPQIMNVGLAYAKKFSNSITGGIVVRYISEGITNVKTQGVGLDAGVQYQTALTPKNKIKKEDFRFGISLKNWGPDMSYMGSGLTYKSTIVNSNASTRNTQMSSQAFNLPTLVHIGASYDMRLDAKSSDTYYHRLTASSNFNYNAFSSNIVSMGIEYAFKESFMVRSAYSWQESITEKDAYRTQYFGYSAGCTVQVPISKSGTMVGLDYAFAPTHVFNGIHSIGIRLVLGNKKS